MAETEDYQKIPSPLNADTVGDKSYSEISLEMDTKIGVHVAASDPHSPYVLAGGTRALSGDWDIGAGRMVQAEKIQARSSLGLSLFEDGGAGIFVKDGGYVGIGTINPGLQLEITGSLKLPKTDGSNGIVWIGNTRLHNYGTHNLFLGEGSGRLGILTGHYNIGFGSFTLGALTSGFGNEAFGYNTLASVNSGSFNLGFGHGTLQLITTGDNNTALGAAAGDLAQNGSGNVFIGFGAGGNSTGNDKLYIANSNTPTPLVYGEFDSGLLVINGSLGVGKSVVNYKIDVDGDINVDSGHVFRINATQVVGARVIDARIDDEIEAGFTTLYPVASGILDAVRDAMIAHGLVAAA